jgi:hypothetical protein
MITVYAVRDFINSLDLSSRVTSFSNDGTNTTITVGNVFHSRAGLVVDIDGTDYTVISANYDTNTLVLAGVIVAPVLLTVPIPYFFHGTFMKLNNELNEVLNIDDKIPMFYLHEVIREKKHNPAKSGLDRTSDIRLFLMDKAPENGDTTANQYADIIVPLSKLADFFTNALYTAYQFGDIDDIEQVNQVEWGTYSDSKGHLKRFFDANLTGIAFSFSLPILKCCN